MLALSRYDKKWQRRGSNAKAVPAAPSVQIEKKKKV